jgi:hypothetical protein
MNNEAFTQNRPQFSSAHTSNDLLFSLHPESFLTSLTYEIVAQSADEVRESSQCSTLQHRTLPG